jgi:hypothetical protein
MTKEPMLATCQGCRHVWPYAWLPMEIGRVAALLPRGCPMCGTTRVSSLLMASRASGDLDRYRDWCAMEALRATHDRPKPVPFTPGPSVERPLSEEFAMPGQPGVSSLRT